MRDQSTVSNRTVFSKRNTLETLVPRHGHHFSCKILRLVLQDSLPFVISLFENVTKKVKSPRLPTTTRRTTSVNGLSHFKYKTGPRGVVATTHYVISKGFRMYKFQVNSYPPTVHTRDLTKKSTNPILLLKSRFN